MPFCEESREINADILIDICGGNIFETIKRGKFYNGITINISVKTLERRLIDKLLDLGWSVQSVADATNININRIKNRKRRLDEKNRD